MYPTLLLALLITTALATPLTRNTTSPHRRDSEEGTPTGLTISIWSVPNCHGTPTVSNVPINLEQGIAEQTVSYSLSDDIGEDMALGFFVDTAWTATGSDTVQASEDGDVADACAAFAYNADADHSKAGCQTLPKAIGLTAIQIGIRQSSEFRKFVFANASVNRTPTTSFFSSSERIQQLPNMNALAETWSRSGRKSSDLYKGTSDEITNELKTWILERQALNAAVINLLWDLFITNDVIVDMQDQNQILENMRVAFKAKQLKNVERVKEYKEKREAQNLAAEFLLATLSHQGLEWEEIPSILGWTELDGEVCSFLRTRDRTFDAERQMKVLNIEKKLCEWQLEYMRREMNEKKEILGIGNPDPVSRTRYPITVPVDVSGLLPPSFNTIHTSQSGDSSPGTISPDPTDRVESLSETNESAEAIARRIEKTGITGEPVRTEKLSKAKIRDLRRKKAKDRAKEAGDAEESPGDDAGEGGSREQIS
ncbi:hypothetical protein BDR22DRAFT_960162 [Usnea florida]